MGKRPEAILIAGPTASGKSALALDVAAKRNVLIINADSMQVYRDLRVLSARPSIAEEARAQHALYGTIDGATNFSVGRWLAEVTTALERAAMEGLVPLVVGGTGLYFKALTQGLSAIPAVPDDVRSELRAWAAGRSPQNLHATLVERDPDTAGRLRPTDPQRVLRALEVHAATGKGLSSLQAGQTPGPLAGRQFEAYRLDVDRSVLRERVGRRFAHMMRHGALDEVRALVDRRLDPALPVMRALGVPSLTCHLAGELSLDEALAGATTATRAYLKRQSTFFRHQLPNFRPIAPDALRELLIADRQLV